MRALVVTDSRVVVETRPDPGAGAGRGARAGARCGPQPRRPRAACRLLPRAARRAPRHPRPRVRRRGRRPGRRRRREPAIGARACSASSAVARRPSCSPSRPGSARRCPSGLDLVDAGGIPEVFVTAHDALGHDCGCRRRRLRLRAGDRLRRRHRRAPARQGVRLHGRRQRAHRGEARTQPASSGSTTRSCAARDFDPAGVRRAAHCRGRADRRRARPRRRPVSHRRDPRRGARAAASCSSEILPGCAPTSRSGSSW